MQITHDVQGKYGMNLAVAKAVVRFETTYACLQKQLRVKMEHTSGDQKG